MKGCFGIGPGGFFENSEVKKMNDQPIRTVFVPRENLGSGSHILVFDSAGEIQKPAVSSDYGGKYVLECGRYLIVDYFVNAQESQACSCRRLIVEQKQVTFEEIDFGEVLDLG